MEIATRDQERTIAAIRDDVERLLREDASDREDKVVAHREEVRRLRRLRREEAERAGARYHVIEQPREVPVERIRHAANRVRRWWRNRGRGGEAVPPRHIAEMATLLRTIMAQERARGRKPA